LIKDDKIENDEEYKILENADVNNPNKLK